MDFSTILSELAEQKKTSYNLLQFFCRNIPFDRYTKVATSFSLTEQKIKIALPVIFSEYEKHNYELSRVNENYYSEKSVRDLIKDIDYLIQQIHQTFSQNEVVE